MAGPVPRPLRRRADWFGSLPTPAPPRVDRDAHGRRIGVDPLEELLVLESLGAVRVAEEGYAGR